MSSNEFDIISTYFPQTVDRADVILGPGDDCAILEAPADQQLISSIDSFVEGTHFLISASPENIGYKSVAISLSDIAAMGGEPAWLMLSITLPKIDHDWLKRCCVGIQEIQKQYGVALIGGDLTRGPLSFTTQITGYVPKGKAIKRSGAKPGDNIYVTGSVGGAGYILQELFNNQSVDSTLLERPTPRVEAGILLRDIATSAIDISDGLAGDLSHILKASQVGASIYCDRLPLSEIIQHLPSEKACQFALSAGDDYELCFTAPEKKNDEVMGIFSNLHCPVKKIGQIEKEKGLRVYDFQGVLMELKQLGWEHF